MMTSGQEWANEFIASSGPVRRKPLTPDEIEMLRRGLQDADKTAAILRERELDGGHKASETCPKCGESLAWSINREAEAK